MSSSLAHPGMAFPQGEEEEEEDVGMMLGGLWTPQSATCKRRWEASTCQREKQGKKLLAVNLAFFGNVLAAQQGSPHGAWPVLPISRAC